MAFEQKTVVQRWRTRIHKSFVERLFWDKRFAHYTWIGIFISLLNIFLLWLLIDVLGIPTLVSATLVVAGTFILRYVLLIFSKIL